MIDDAFRIFIGCYLFACGFSFPLVVLCLAWAPRVDDDAEHYHYYGHEFSRVGQGDRRQGVKKDEAQDAVTEDFLFDE